MKNPSLLSLLTAAIAILISSCAQKTTTAPPPPAPPVASSTPADVPAVQPPPPAPVQVEDAQAKLQALLAEALKPIYFDYERSVVKPTGKEILARIGAILKTNPGLSITVEGNTDERGSTEYNQALGERRADAAFKWLESYGASKSQLKTVSYGKERPVAQGHDEASWSRNRRDDFTSKTM